MLGSPLASPSARRGPRRPPVGPHLLGLVSLFIAFGSGLPRAEAQYKNQQVGFEGGYSFVEDDLGLDEHAPIAGFRAGYKASDHWWFTARAMLSFRGDDPLQDNTVILFHLTPIDVRYYFETDAFRPFIGGATAFQFLFNTNVPSSVQWGVGPVAGMEFKLRRDLFLGFQVDGLYLIAFDGANVPVVHATTQLIFFL